MRLCQDHIWEHTQQGKAALSLLDWRNGGLPFFHDIKWIDQHQHVQGKAIADHEHGENLKPNHNQQAGPDRQALCQPEAQQHRANIRHGIHDTVPEIIERNRDRAIMFNHGGGVFRDLPGGFDQSGDQQTPAKGHTTGNQPEKTKEYKSVDEMAGCVPVGQVLGSFRTEGFTPPKFNGATFTNRLSPHPQKDDGGGQNNKGGEKQGNMFFLYHGANQPHDHQVVK